MTHTPTPNCRRARPARSAGLLLAASLLALPAFAQQRAAESGPAVVRGLYNWIHTTGNADESFAFYRDVFGIALARSPFAGPARPDAPVEAIRPAAEARGEALVWDLTDTKGARFRTAFMHAPNTPFGLEVSEFFDIPRETRAANPWDPGASMLVFAVRDLSAVVARLGAAHAPIVTLGGAPLDTPDGRSILVRDPDGYLVRAIQASAAEIAQATDPGDIIRTSITVSVADTQRSLALYRDMLGFEVGGTRRATPADLRLYGVTDGTLDLTTTTIPGTDITVLLTQFSLPPSAAMPAKPFRWRIQDVGAPQFQLQVTELDALLERTERAGYRFLSVGGKPIQRAFGRFVFIIDSDGVLVEFVEPSTAAR